MSKPFQTKFLILTSIFAALTAVGAFIRIPIPYVPLTLQTFFVLLAGASLGPVLGSLSQLLYLIIGLAGVPIFANGGGIAYVFQPTFGYLLSYPIAAFAVGSSLWGISAFPQQRTPSRLHLAGAFAAGTAIIYFLGVAGLYLNLNYLVNKPTSFEQTLWVGCFVFLPSTLIKIAAAVYIAPRLTDLLRP